MKAEMDMTTHSCSYYCTNPPCIKAQRDEMRAEMEAMQAKLARVRELIVMFESDHAEGFHTGIESVCALVRQALRGEHE